MDERILIGSGSHGNVYKTEANYCEDFIALKKVKTGKNGVLNIMEIYLLGSLDHPNIIKSLSIDYLNNFVQIQMPLGKSVKSFDIFQAEKWSEELISAVAYLHHNEIYHGDIKIENIIIIEDKINLIDFGVSCTEYDNCQCFQSIIYAPPENMYQLHEKKFNGNPYPEIFKQPLSKKGSDYWALGICILYLFYGKHPFCSPDSVIIYLDNPEIFIGKIIAKEKWKERILNLMKPKAKERSLSVIDKFPEIKMAKRNFGSRFTKGERYFNILSNWLYDVIHEFNFSKYSYVASLDLIARIFYNITEIDSIQLFGVTAFFIIQKAIEESPKAIETMRHICVDIYSSKEILEKEIFILKNLKGDVIPLKIFRLINDKEISEPMTLKQLEEYWNLMS